MSLAFASTDCSAEEFRERRTRAVRSGNPAWLWPEVSAAEWAAAAGHIGNAVASILAAQPARLARADAQALSLACYTSGTGPLLGYWLEQELLEASEEASALLALHLRHARTRAERVEVQSREIVSALVDSSVPVVVLKGGHTAHAYFPDAATRPASDLDLLIPSDTTVESEIALARLGLECTSRKRRERSWAYPDSQTLPRSTWLVHAQDPWSVDLQTSLDFSANPGAPLVRFDAADPIGTSEPWPVDAQAGVLSQPLLLLHLAVHASGGLHSLTLLRIIEIVLVVREDLAAGRLSWDEFLKTGAGARALGSAYPALRMAEKLAAGTIPPQVLEICAELTPRRARKLVDSLEPANAHRVDRASLAEHFMWVSGLRGWARQLGSDIVPGSEFWPIYEKRAYRLLRRQITR